MNKLILIRGVPGSGKSTLAKNKYVPLGFVHLEADMYFERTGKYLFDPKLLGKAHGWCQYETKRNLIAGNPVVVTNTFTTLREIKDYEFIARECDVLLEVIHAQGNFNNVHGVPADKLAAMKSRWQAYPGEIAYLP